MPNPTPIELSARTYSGLPARSQNAHKGDFGHVLIIGGNKGMGGAVCLAAEAAARVGAGLVSVATQAEHVSAVMAARPEVMCYAVQTGEDLKPLLARATVILLGPGLGQSQWSIDLYSCAIASHLVKVIDADALNLLSTHGAIDQNNWILTPHPGEASRLLDCATIVIQADRLSAAQQLQQRYGGVVVLKGAGSIVQGSGTPYLCTAGNPGMASGGMGDVLGGVIAGLLAQGETLEKAAAMGTLVHALAADRAVVDGMRGLLAKDLMPHLRQLVNQ